MKHRIVPMIVAFFFSLGAAAENYADWNFSKTVSVNTVGMGLAGSVTRFPLLVRLNASNFEFSRAQFKGQDIRFAKADGTPMPYQIDSWDAVNHSATVWVLADTVRKDTLLSFRVYYGNPAAVDSSRGSAVFDTANGYQAVFHFNEATGDTAQDATQNAFRAAPKDTLSAGLPSDTSGAIGRSKNFKGGGSTTSTIGGYYVIPGSAGGRLNFAENGPYTISAWVNLRPSASSTVYRCILSKSDLQYNLMKNTSSNQYQFNPFSMGDGSGFPNRWEQASGGPVTQGSWQFVVGVMRGADIESLYVDGVNSGSFSSFSTTNVRDTGFNVTIGRRSDFAAGNGGNRFWDGLIDEATFSSRDRSADWIKLDYATQKPGAIVVVFGPLEILHFGMTGPKVNESYDLPNTEGVNTDWSSSVSADYHGGISQSKADVHSPFYLHSLLDPTLLRVEHNNYGAEGGTRAEVTPDRITLTHYSDSIGGTVDQYTTLDDGSIQVEEVDAGSVNADAVDADTLDADQIHTVVVAAGGAVGGRISLTGPVVTEPFQIGTGEPSDLEAQNDAVVQYDSGIGFSKKQVGSEFYTRSRLDAVALKLGVNNGSGAGGGAALEADPVHLALINYSDTLGGTGWQRTDLDASSLTTGTVNAGTTYSIHVIADTVASTSLVSSRSLKLEGDGRPDVNYTLNADAENGVVISMRTSDTDSLLETATLNADGLSVDGNVYAATGISSPTIFGDEITGGFLSVEAMRTDSIYAEHAMYSPILIGSLVRTDSLRASATVSSPSVLATLIRTDSLYSAHALNTPLVIGTLVKADSVYSAYAVNSPVLIGGLVRTDSLYAAHVVTTPKWNVVPDYVFEPGYKTRSLPEVENFVRSKKHLPGMPSAQEISTRGMDLTDMNLKLLKNVEELTLHVIELDKSNKRLEHAVKTLKNNGSK